MKITLGELRRIVKEETKNFSGRTGPMSLQDAIEKLKKYREELKQLDSLPPRERMSHDHRRKRLKQHIKELGAEVRSAKRKEQVQ